MNKAIAYTIAATLAFAGAACGDDDNNDIDDDNVVPEDDTSSTLEHVVERTDIVSDQAGAQVQDPTLINAWGLAFNPMGAAWVSSAGSGISQVYDAAGNQLIESVTIPGPEGSDEASEPTGQAFNSDADAFEGDAFIFVTEDGTIAGWQPSDGDQATLRIDNSDSEANYKGVTIVQDADGESWLFAADFHNGKVDVWDSSYTPVAIEDGFADSELPDGYAPFNVKAWDGALIVTYALQDDDAEDDVPGEGNGYVDVYDVEGNLTSRLIAQGNLNSPWGIAVTPDTFDAAPERLLIGNFGDGKILVYSVDTSADPITAEGEGPLVDADGNDIEIDGLWALEFGVDEGGFSADALYFTAGPDDEQHGLFGVLESAELSTGGGAGNGPTGPGGSGY